jgi:hypothetical protein
MALFGWISFRGGPGSRCKESEMEARIGRRASDIVRQKLHT